MPEEDDYSGPPGTVYLASTPSGEDRLGLMDSLRESAGRIREEGEDNIIEITPHQREMLDSMFIDEATPEGLREGTIGTIMGIPVVETNRIEEDPLDEIFVDEECKEVIYY